MDYQKATVKRKLCEEIDKGDKVEILPEYNYMLGTNERIKEHFNIKPGEVVVKKTKTNEKNEEHIIIKCNRSDLIIEK